jgi:transposase
MKSITLDAHSGESQMVVMSEEGEILIELRVETTPEELRRVVGGVPGPKRVIFEEGPLSAMIHDALEGVADEIISCDPTRNALIARSENSNDEQDARRLGVLHRAGAIHPVHIPAEPYRTLRSLTHHDQGLAEAVAATKNRIKALCRRNAIPCKGAAVYHATGRKETTGKLPNAALRWQMESLYRQLDALRLERVRARGMVLKQARKTKVVKHLRTIPGVGPKTGPVIAAWIADPRRFRNRNALSSYGGLGLKQDVSNWKVLRHAHASRRGNRELKRALFIAARCALRGTSALRRRYDARCAAGWEDRKAIRDVARTILFIACAIWKKGTEYDDAKVSVPENDRGAR